MYFIEYSMHQPIFVLSSIFPLSISPESYPFFSLCIKLYLLYFVEYNLCQHVFILFNIATLPLPLPLLFLILLIYLLFKIVAMNYKYSNYTFKS